MESPSETGVARAFLAESAAQLAEQFVPKIRRALDVVAEEDVWWRGSPGENSIGNLLLHLAGNVRQWIISGMGGAEDRRERPREFADRGSVSKEEAFRALEATVAEAVAVLRRLDEADLLARKTIQGFESTGLAAVLHVVEHFSYHTGQIVFIAKLRTGRDLRFYDL
jgi:uncharacterized damage-inducible protein DinB